MVVGNEKSLKSHGGKARVETDASHQINDFVGTHANVSLLYVCVDDQLAAVLALSGNWKIKYIQCFVSL